MMNKKGSTYVELLVAVFVLLSITIITTNIINYVARNNQEIKIQTALTQEMQAQIVGIYQMDWANLESQEIETPYGNISVSYELSETDFNTNKLEVTFLHNENKVTYQIERSEYYDK